MQNPVSGEVTLLPNGPEGERIAETKAKQGWPIWREGELLTLKGVVWQLAEIRPGNKELLLRFHGPAPGIEAMMARLQGQADAK